MSLGTGGRSGWNPFPSIASERRPGDRREVMGARVADAYLPAGRAVHRHRAAKVQTQVFIRYGAPDKGILDCHAALSAAVAAAGPGSVDRMARTADPTVVHARKVGHRAVRGKGQPLTLGNHLGSKVEATTGFEPVNRGLAERAVASAGVRWRRFHARIGHLFGVSGRSRPPLLLPALVPGNLVGRSLPGRAVGGPSLARGSAYLKTSAHPSLTPIVSWPSTTP